MESTEVNLQAELSMTVASSGFGAHRSFFSWGLGVV